MVQPVIRRKPVEWESIEQQIVVRWLDFMGIDFFAVPNGRKRAWAEARKLKLEGVKPGIPDLIVIDPPPVRPNIHTLAIEMKRADRKVKPKPEQLEWHAAMRARGWYVLVAYGADDAILQLKLLGYAEGR